MPIFTLFNSLPRELRLDVWDFALETETRHIMLVIEAHVTYKSWPTGPGREELLVNGAFRDGNTGPRLPVYPEHSSMAIRSIGAVSSEARAAVLKQFPDLIRIWRRSGAQLLLRCDLRRDAFWVVACETERRYFNNHTQFARDIHDSLVLTQTQPHLADEFKRTLSAIRRLFLPYEVNMSRSLEELRRDASAETAKYSGILPCMTSLRTVSTFHIRWATLRHDGLSRGKTGQPPVNAESDRFGTCNPILWDFWHLYQTVNSRFLGPAYYTKSITDIHNVYESVQQEIPDEESQEFADLLDHKMRHMGFDNHDTASQRLELPPWPPRERQPNGDTWVLSEFVQP
ncbi:hypothetical protein FZEAL_8627 [Fusarium zealandicum]|uniref:2EXR domain-containing protein n=1 Tax=Fusarium zealandicum TaxID=1053134 RepID=A0A8H4XHM8_9HYPO|nr:hypothetical protein FZEAL_8627 [Fusarium zealandicum]